MKSAGAGFFFFLLFSRLFDSTKLRRRKKKFHIREKKQGQQGRGDALKRQRGMEMTKMLEDMRSKRRIQRRKESFTSFDFKRTHGI